MMFDLKIELHYCRENHLRVVKNGLQADIENKTTQQRIARR